MPNSIILQDQDGENIFNAISAFFRVFMIGKLLHKCNVQKEKGVLVIDSPLHGTGLIPVNRVLAESGFERVYTVPGQAIQDGGFLTVKKPNPENLEANVQLLWDCLRSSQCRQRQPRVC